VKAHGLTAPSGTGRPGLSLLSASKAAVRSLARTWSRELLDQRIRVNALSPGGIDTPLHGRGGGTPEQVEAKKNQLAAQVPLGRIGEADEIAQAVLFLASDESRYMLARKRAMSRAGDSPKWRRYWRVNCDGLS
jgi:NAD(P)-dependent dehydrogenase (short-subunit alcohol dehydrogenase family)